MTNTLTRRIVHLEDALHRRQRSQCEATRVDLAPLTGGERREYETLLALVQTAGSYEVLSDDQLERAEILAEKTIIDSDTAA